MSGVSRTFVDRLLQERSNMVQSIAYYEQQAADWRAQVEDYNAVLAVFDVEPEQPEPAPEPEASDDSVELVLVDDQVVWDDEEPDDAQPNSEPSAEVPETSEPAAAPEAAPESPAAQDGYVDEDGEQYAWTDSEPDEGSRTEQ